MGTESALRGAGGDKPRPYDKTEGVPVPHRRCAQGHRRGHQAACAARAGINPAPTTKPKACPYRTVDVRKGIAEGTRPPARRGRG